MTTTDNLPATRTVPVIAIRLDETAKPATYTLTNPWRKAIYATGGLSTVTLAGGAVASCIDLDLLPHAAGFGVGALALLLAATGMHARHDNRARSMTNFRKNPS